MKRRIGGIDALSIEVSTANSTEPARPARWTHTVTHIPRRAAGALLLVTAALTACVDGSIVDSINPPLPPEEQLDVATAADAALGAISIPTGFEAEGIELGKGHEFFLGAFSYSSFFGPAFGVSHEQSAFAGAIYKGNLRTGAGAILVPPTGKPVSGLSYDPRTDYLYAATGHAAVFGTGIHWDQGVIVYDASSGELVREITFGDGIAINDCLVTRTGVYCTDSVNPDLYKVVLENGGRIPSTPVVEVIHMPDFEMVPGFNANGLVGDFDGRQLVLVNTSTGVLYLVDTESGAASPLRIEGAEQLFPNGDGLYLEGRTLYILQNFSDKVAVVQLSGDLTGGDFIRNIPGAGAPNPLNIATTIIGFGNSLYAVNTHFFDLIFGDPASVQSEVVRLRK